MTTVRNITTDYTLTPHDAVQGNGVSTLVQVDTTGGPVTLTLPPTDFIEGGQILIQMVTGSGTSANTLTIASNRPNINLNPAKPTFVSYTQIGVNAGLNTVTCVDGTWVPS